MRTPTIFRAQYEKISLLLEVAVEFDLTNDAFSYANPEERNASPNAY